MDMLVILLLCLGMSYVLSRVFVHLRLPSMLGPLVTGIIFSLPVMQDWLGLNKDLFSVLSSLGMILLLFYTGLKIDFREIKSLSRQITRITFFGAAVPAVTGFFIMYAFGFSWIAAFVAAIILAVSDESISVVLLEESKLVNTKIGQIIIGSGIMDDVLSIIFVAVLTVLAPQAIGQNLFRLLFDAFTLIVIFVILQVVLIPLILKYYKNAKLHSKHELFNVTLILVLVMAVLSEYLEFGLAIGALLAGVIVKYSFIRSGKEGLLEEHEIDDMFKTITFGFVVLFFFISIGLNIDFESVLLLPSLLLVFAALFGKWLGVFFGFGVPETKSRIRSSNLVAWGLNPRGAIALIVLNLARDNNLISIDIFSSLVFVTILTTIISPIVFKWYVLKKSHHFGG